ncbi:MAG: SDR family NAD(P)-dependent oxidoreductase, partial [Idiomarina sp.]|nr:SDR family NAD(P)-dependent oxidoreductase [Idiomarina sp.]
MQIKDSVIVITGGAQGLGLAMAEDFAKQGAKLALIDINGDVLGDAQEQCEKLGAAKVVG